MQRTGDPWQSWDAGRVWSALACWRCCVAEGHVPLSCNPDELPEAIGAPSVSTDANLDATIIRVDIKRAIAELVCHEREQAKPRTAEMRVLVLALMDLGPVTRHTIWYRGNELSWVEYETAHWSDVARRLHLQDWQDARRTARNLCIALAGRLGFKGQYRWE